MSDHTSPSVPTTQGERERVHFGQLWRRKKDGRVVRVERVTNVSVGPSPFFDIKWHTIDKPSRYGACFENYWFKNYELLTEATDG